VVGNLQGEDCLAKSGDLSGDFRGGFDGSISENEIRRYCRQGEENSCLGQVDCDFIFQLNIFLKPVILYLSVKLILGFLAIAGTVSSIKNRVSKYGPL
jgi:hypothetical protein